VFHRSAAVIQKFGCRGCVRRLRDESVTRGGRGGGEGSRIRPAAFVTRRQHRNLLASAMMGLQAVNETSQAGSGSFSSAIGGLSLPPPPPPPGQKTGDSGARPALGTSPPTTSSHPPSRLICHISRNNSNPRIRAMMKDGPVYRSGRPARVNVRVVCFSLRGGDVKGRNGALMRG